MKRLIFLFWLILGASAFGINITNYPATNAFDGSMTFLLSKASAATNFNIQADLIASTNWAIGTFLPASGNAVSSTYVTTSPLTNHVNIANVDTPGAIVTNGQSTAITFSNTVTLGNILGNAGTGGSNIVVGRMYSTNTLWQNTFLDLNGPAGPGQNVIEYYTNNSSKFSVSRAGAVSCDSGVTANGNIQASAGGYVQFGTSRTKLESTSSTNFNVRDSAGTGYSHLTAANITATGALTATNGVQLMVKSSFTTNFTCTTNLQTYLCNGTNQIVTLPNAAYVPNSIYRFTSTNGYGSYIVTNATGSQTIRDGVSLSHKQIGIAPFDIFSDGAQWWLAARDQSVEPNAQFSCSTNIPLTSANTAYPVTFNSTDFNNSQGIALALGTNGTHFSKMWITNSGQYEFTPSIVIGMGNVSHTVRYWFRSNDTNIPNSTTPTKVGGNDTIVVTVPFVVNITTPTAIEIWAESDGVNDALTAGAASGSYPASPSVICPVKRISDTWP